MIHPPRPPPPPAQIPAVRIQILIEVGDQDMFTPPAMSQKLIEAANNPKRLNTVSGAAHNGMFRFGRQEVSDHITAFLETLHELTVGNARKYCFSDAALQTAT